MGPVGEGTTRNRCGEAILAREGLVRLRRALPGRMRWQDPHEPVGETPAPPWNTHWQRKKLHGSDEGGITINEPHAWGRYPGARRAQ